jgi:hypothetical protein
MNTDERVMVEVRRLGDIYKNVWREFPTDNRAAQQRRSDDAWRGLVAYVRSELAKGSIKRGSFRVMDDRGDLTVSDVRQLFDEVNREQQAGIDAAARQRVEDDRSLRPYRFKVQMVSERLVEVRAASEHEARSLAPTTGYPQVRDLGEPTVKHVVTRAHLASSND